MEKLQFTAMTLKELYTHFEVSLKTFKSWTEPFSDEVGALRGKVYTPKQVKLIFHNLV